MIIGVVRKQHLTIVGIERDQPGPLSETHTHGKKLNAIMAVLQILALYSETT